MKEAQFEDLDKACYLWFMQQRSKGARCPVHYYREKFFNSFQFFIQTGIQDLSKLALASWFNKFCCRHGMRSISLQGESLSADTSGIDAFKNDLTSLMEKEGYTLSQLCNADETGL